jgi:sister chromatid cohesion protein DCC1
VIHLIKQQKDDNDTEFTPETVTAIAKCGSTLELQGLSSEEIFASAKNMLARILRIWDEGMTFVNDDGDVDLDGTETTELNMKRMMTVKRSIINDLPFSDLQCQKVWIELCAFVPDSYKSPSGGRPAFRPSAAVKLGIWKMILEGCILHSIDVEKQFLVRDLWKAVLGDEDDGDREKTVSRSLFDAIVRRLAERAGENGAEGDSELKCLSCLIILADDLLLYANLLG